MKLLIFGKDGQVGSALRRQLSDRTERIVLGRHDVDLQDFMAVEREILRHRPDIVINAAAYTAVDKAESEPEMAQIVNARAPGVMAEAAGKVDAVLIHYSTDYVFDGQADQPYDETCTTAPLNVYGETKLAGEQAIVDTGARHIILRTGWVYAAEGRNFLNTVLRLAHNSDPLRIVDDQFGSPTCADAIATATRDLLDRMAVDQAAAARCGTYHMTCGGVTTWHGFATEIARSSGFPGVRVVPIGTAEFPTSATRPRYSVLSNVKLARDFDIQLPNWRQALARTLHPSAPLG